MFLTLHQVAIEMLPKHPYKGTRRLSKKALRERDKGGLNQSKAASEGKTSAVHKEKTFISSTVYSDFRNHQSEVGVLH